MNPRIIENLYGKKANLKFGNVWGIIRANQNSWNFIHIVVKNHPMGEYFAKGEHKPVVLM